jgi:hypothetical protein
MTNSGWDDAFHDLWLHAIRHRGILTSLSELPGPSRDSGMAGWPRTHGADVLAIAAVIDPVLREIPPQPGGHGIDRQWRSCASDLAMFALEYPEYEYTQNRVFWATLAKVAAYLASIDAPVPAALWRALLAEITGHHRRRNANLIHDDYLGVNANSYDQLWQAQKDALARLRGADIREPIGDMRGSVMAVPRTTLTDVLHLAGFWTDALARIEHKPLAASPAAVATLGLGSVKRRWQTAVAEVNALAESADPDSTFPENHAFWRTAGALSITLAVLEEAPAAPNERHGHRNAYPGEGAAEKMWDKQRDDYATAHGFDIREAAPGRVGRPMKIPRTTNGEILALAAYWNDAWLRLEVSRATGNLTTEHGLATLKERWEAVMKDVDAIARPGKADDVYAKNPEFWREAFEVAQTLDLFKELPSKFDIAVGIAKELPERFGHAVGSVTRFVGDIAQEAGKGFIAGLGKPLLIGGGVVLGLYLLFRHDRKAA